MNVAAATTPSPVQGTSARTPSTASGPIASDYTTFLKMLTAQLENQDPLNPIDNSEYAVQLATFSGVEQQTRTNSLLAGLADQLGLMGMSELAGWVGKKARAEMPVWFDGRPVTVSAQAESRATGIELVARDDSGRIVARDPVPLGVETLDWDGLTPSGQPLAPGLYTLSLDSYADGALIGSAPVESYGRIVEARGGAGGTTLLFEGGVEVPAGRITALRAD